MAKLEFRCACGARLANVSWKATYLTVTYKADGSVQREVEDVDDDIVDSEWQCSRDEEHDVTRGGTVDIKFNQDTLKYELVARE